MAERRTTEDLVRRIRSALNLAAFASEEECNAAIRGVVRIMEQNIEVLANHTPRTITKTETVIIDNKAQIEIAVREKYAALGKVDELEREIFKLNEVIKDLRARKDMRKDTRNDAGSNDPDRTKADPIVKPPRDRTDEFDVPLIRTKLDDIFRRYNLWLQPSLELQAVLKKPNLLDVLPYLPREYTAQFNHITLQQDIFKEIMEVFVLKKGVAAGYRRYAVLLIALLTNMPFDYDEKLHRKLLFDVGNKWADLRRDTQIPPWAAFAIRCGVLQENLHRLESHDLKFR